MLYQLGGTQFRVVPFNTDEVSHEVGADFAAKDLLGAMKSREFTGQADETYNFHCQIFPRKIGGMAELTELQVACAAGQPLVLVRGDYTNLGWYDITKIADKHTYLDVVGIGRVIEVTIDIVRVPTPDTTTILGALLRLFG